MSSRVEGPKALGGLVSTVVRRVAQRHLAIHELQRRWARIVGKELAKHTRPVRLWKETLYVHVDEPGASFVLTLEKPRLLGRLKAKTKHEIKEIVVRAGEV